MRVLIGCEYSGVVRDAFIRQGHDAMSCDLLPTESPGHHHHGDIVPYLVLETLSARKFDLIIAHPDCTAMANCGNSTYGRGMPKHHERIAALKWTAELWELCKIVSPRVCFENPISVLFKHLHIKAQYVHPWQFGHPEQKKTGLALHELPDLKPTKDVYAYMMTLPRKKRERVHFMSPGKNRGKERSRFYTGIAEAMAEQWGDL